MKCIPVLCILVATITCGKSANILGIFPLPVKSHFEMYERLLKRLAEKGHNVDVVTQFPSEEVPPRYNQLSLIGSMPIFLNNMSSTIIDMFQFRLFLIYHMTKMNGADVCEATLKTDIMKKIKRTNKNYDLVITEIFGNDCMLGYSHILNAPTISVMSSVSLPWANDRIANPDNPSYIPTYFLPLSAVMSFYERVQNTVLLVTSKFLYYFVSLKSGICLDANLPKLEDLAHKTSLLLVNSHFSANYPRPTVPNFIEVGGLHIRQPKPLSMNFSPLIDHKNGVIYLSMGSMAQTESFAREKLQSLFDALAELPYKILWKADGEKFSPKLTIPKNIYFEKWMPQIDILCHPNTKLFITHGGLMGFQEAIYCGLPMLGIPLFADQEHNIRTGEELGVSLKVSYHNITKEIILQAVHQLLDNPKFKEKSQQASEKFKTRPMSPLDTAVYWVEYVIRHKRVPHIRSAKTVMPWYEYYLFDVIVVTVIIVWVATWTLKFFVNKYFNYY